MEKVEIVWEDSTHYNVGWEKRKGLKSLLLSTCYSVGYIIDETDDFITLAQSYTNQDEIMHRISIPKSSIKRKRILEESEIT